VDQLVDESADCCIRDAVGSNPIDAPVASPPAHFRAMVQGFSAQGLLGSRILGQGFLIEDIGQFSEECYQLKGNLNLGA